MSVPASEVKAAAERSTLVHAIERTLRESENVLFWNFETVLNDTDFQQCLDLLKQWDTRPNMVFAKHTLSQTQQEAILNVLLMKSKLKYLILNGFDLSPKMVEMLSKSSLCGLGIYDLAKSASNDLQLKQLARCNTLEALVIRNISLYKSRLAIGQRENAVEQKSPVISEKLHIQDLLTFIGMARLQELEVPDIRIEPKDVDAVLEAIQRNPNLGYICLPDSVGASSIERLRKYFQENSSKQYPVDRYRQVKEEGRGYLYYSKSLEWKIGDLFEQRSENSILKAELLQLGFDPNGYVVMSSGPASGRGPLNPILNLWIANEFQTQVVRTIEMFSDELNPNQRDEPGRPDQGSGQKTVLIIAALAYSADTVLLALLKHCKGRIELNAQDDHGCTALHYLCAYGKVELVYKLINAGADPKIRDKQGRTPFDYVNLSKEDVENILESVSMDPNRDVNAKRDSLVNHMEIGFNWDQHPCANIETLEAVNKKVQSGECPVYNYRARIEHGRREECSEEQWTAEYKKTKELFSGTSIIDTCIKRQKELAEIVQSPEKLKAMLKAEAESSTVIVTTATRTPKVSLLPQYDAHLQNGSAPAASAALHTAVRKL